MNLNRVGGICDSARWLAGFALFALVTVQSTPAFSQVWWDNFPRVVETSSLNVAQTYGANAVMDGVANDSGWGLWFTYGGDNGAAASNTCASFQAAGIVSVSYNESYGSTENPIDELQWSASLQRWTTAHQFWSWEDYSGGTIVWAGAWTWFDSFTNDLPANKSEPSYFSRPYTRMNPVYGGGPMLYPNGTIATGFLNNDTTATNPCDSCVYDAGGSKTIYGSVQGDTLYSYNSQACLTNQPHAGELWIPAKGEYAGAVRVGRDAACPCWTNYAFAETLAAVQLTGLQATWTDNFSSWDSFMTGGPVSCAFGDWSVALFQNYLTNKFTTNQLASWGVLATNAPPAAITNFNVRAYLLTVASNQFGLRTTNLADAAWLNSGWLTNPVWSAFKIFRRQNGSATLTNYDQAVHAAAVQAGQTNFAMLVDDQLPAMGGWARGTLDLPSTQLSMNGNITAGSRGFGVPPFARLSPVYKAIREQGRSHFANVWLYNGGYTSQLTNSGPTLALFYEMLATETMPLFVYGDTTFCGTPQMQSNFMTFVAQSAAPAFANRVPTEEVGLYLSTSSIIATWLPGDAENFADQNHQYAVWGWGTALSQLHHQYRIVPEWKLNNSGLLQALKVLIIPNAEAFEPADVAMLQTWVTNGGCLIVTGDSGSLLGESGNFAPTNKLVLAPLTGVTNFSTAPARRTNFLGAGAVYYYSNNVGYVYYNTNTAGRAAQLATFGTALTNAYAFLQVQPVLASSNAPATVGLTLYQNPSASKTFVDLNNFNVSTNFPYAITNTPAMEVDLACPGWLTNGVAAMATIVSPDGPLSVTSLSLNGNRVYLQLPSVTNYLSVILQPTLALIITPATGFTASGAVGGPFNITNQIFLLTNLSAASLNWTLANTSLWLNVSPGSGTLVSGGQTTVTANLNSTAYNLAVGTYSANVWFTNQTTGVAQLRQFTLQAFQPLAVSPTNGFTSSGPVGGPFSVTTQNFSLTNMGTALLNWSVNNTVSWLTASPNSGALAAGGQTTLTVGLNSAANSLASGIYNASVVITNQNGEAVVLPFTLLVGQSLVQNGGFEAGTFTNWTQSGNTAYTSVTSNSSFVHSGTYGAELGPSGSLGYLSQTLPTFAGQNYLLSLWMDSPDGETPNEFNVSWNGNTLIDLVNMPELGWTNLQFIVTASGSSTVLQIGARDDPTYLALDDVSVTPISATLFQALTKTNGTLNFTWNALTGLVYQVQYKTNLLQTNWINLGTAITATNLTATATNLIGPDPQRFYRLQLLY